MGPESEVPRAQCLRGSGWTRQRDGSARQGLSRRRVDTTLRQPLAHCAQSLR